MKYDTDKYSLSTALLKSKVLSAVPWTLPLNLINFSIKDYLYYNIHGGAIMQSEKHNKYFSPQNIISI
jgi:hypothetical protein